MALDRLTGNERVISWDRYLINEGNVWHASQYYTAAAAAVINMTIKTTSTGGDLHTKFNIETSGQCLMQFYEGVTVSAAGTSISAFNLKRDMSTSALETLFYNCTWSTKSETLLATEIVNGATMDPSRMGAVTDDDVWILKPSTRYLLQLTNQAGATVTAAVNVRFFEMSI